MSKQQPKPKTAGFSLQPEELKRAPQLTGGKLEEIGMKNATAAINDPRLKELEKSEAAELQRIMIASMQAIPGAVQQNQPVQQPPEEQPHQQEYPTFQQKVEFAQRPQNVPPPFIFFTGRLGIGKDHCATAAGYNIVGFADPMYQLANHFFGTSVSATEGKDAPGMRTFLQTIGQWGRGDVNAEYPYTPLRAVFITMIRSLAAASALPDSKAWEKFGYQDFWVDRLIAKTAAAPGRLAVTNCRFENEFTRLKNSNFQHWHIIANPNTWTARLAAKKLTPQSPECNNTSEALAKKLDANVVKLLSTERNGPKLRVIWNDPAVKCPSPRLHTIEEFLALTAP